MKNHVLLTETNSIFYSDFNPNLSDPSLINQSYVIPRNLYLQRFQENQNCIYFICFGNLDTWKIGYTRQKKWSSRLKQLRHEGYAMDNAMFAFIKHVPDAVAAEKMVHQSLSHEKITREVFTANFQSIFQFIAFEFNQNNYNQIHFPVEYIGYKKESALANFESIQGFFFNTENQWEKQLSKKKYIQNFLISDQQKPFLIISEKVKADLIKYFPFLESDFEKIIAED